MIKRSRSITIAILGATAFALAGCQEEQVDAAAFPDLQSCKSAANANGLFSAQECDAAFAEAAALHVEAAPRYDSLAVCEEQHGQGACGDEATATSGGSGGIFLPLMAGYLIGNMMRGGAGAGAAASQPLYKTADGKFTNAARTSTFNSNAGAAKLGTSQFAKPTSTMGKAPMTSATAAARGGFGQGGGTRSSSGG